MLILLKHIGNDKQLCTKIQLKIYLQMYLNYNRVFQKNLMSLTKTWYKEGSEVPPVIQGSKVSPFSLSISQCAECLYPLLQTTPCMAIPLFVFFPKSPLLARLFRQYYPNEIPDKHKNKLMWQNNFFIFRRLKNVKCFFCKQYFYKQNQAEI